MSLRASRVRRDPFIARPATYLYAILMSFASAVCRTYLLHFTVNPVPFALPRPSISYLLSPTYLMNSIIGSCI